MNKIIIVPIEPLETRYTQEWYTHLPQQLTEYLTLNGLHKKISVYQLDVEAPKSSASAGAFLNFADTNIYKSKQFLKLCEILPTLKAGDKILFTDAWNPTIIQLRYMLDLMNIPVEIHGMWHAGSYDAHDFLGRAFDKSWSYQFERSLFYALDKNYFATQFHLDMFNQVLGLDGSDTSRTKIVGWPMEYLKHKLHVPSYKLDTVLFPHRISDEKQPEIFKQLAKVLPNYNFVVCQEQELTKSEYHKLLSNSKIVFSASLQETLGIGMYEGLLCGATPVMPSRLSYVEMFKECPSAIMYPSEWATSVNTANIDALAQLIDKTMKDFKVNEGKSRKGVDSFFNGKLLYENLCFGLIST